MAQWIVRRWCRYGHDRLYAATPGGTDLGYLDLKTGRYHSDDLSNLPLLRAAIEEHRGGDAARLHAGGGASAPKLVNGPSVVTTHPPVQHLAGSTPAALMPDRPRSPGMDLADVRAGASARARALEERRQQGIVRHAVSRLFNARTDERAWRIGADGEEAVAAQFTALGPQWRVLHAVPVGDRGADIDHVVIGPGGVFTVNAKHRPGAAIWVGGDVLMVNRRREPYIRNSRFEARRASRMLAEHVGFPVPVTGIIALVGVRSLLVRNQPDDGAVAVVTRGAIVPFLHTQPDRLNFREIDAIHEVARRSTTWQR